MAEGGAGNQQARERPRTQCSGRTVADRPCLLRAIRGRSRCRFHPREADRFVRDPDPAAMAREVAVQHLLVRAAWVSPRRRCNGIIADGTRQCLRTAMPGSLLCDIHRVWTRILTNKWWTCEYFEFNDISTFTEWQIVNPSKFLLPVVANNDSQVPPILPISAIITYLNKTNPRNRTETTVRADFNHFQRIQSTDRHFQLTPNMICANSPSAQLPLPKMPNYFRFKGEQVLIENPSPPSLTYTIEQYNHDQGIFIQDMVNAADQGMASDKSYTRVVTDFNSGTDGTSVDMSNIVDIRSTQNKEVGVRIHTNVENTDHTFYSDLNGFQMQKRKYYEKLTLQGNIYPMPTMAYVQDGSRRVSVLSAQSSGVGNILPSAIDVMFDRRLNQDDNRGLGQGVLDNRPTPNRFRLLFEQRSTNVEIVDPETSFPSLLAQLSSLALIHPMFVVPRSFHGMELALDKEFFLLTDSLPCEVHMLNLRVLQNSDDDKELQYVPKESSLLLLRHLPSDCSFPKPHLSCLVQEGKIVGEGALSVFTDVLNSSHVLEQAACVECIWTLAFNEKARAAIIEYPGLVDAIEKLAASEDATVRKNVEGALWVIRGNIDRKVESKDVVDKHIFISYSWKEKDLVRKIHAFLVEAGYTIWVDWEEMGGSTLESMGRAVENSWVVLICMSDGYKQSPNCRTEAGYTYQRKKQYIPLLVQLKYQPDGWLGALLESRLFFDFSGKYPFDTPKQGLLRELKVVQSGREGPRPTAPAPVPEVTGSKPRCFSFSVDVIKELFITKGFREFPEEFSNLNGELLWQLRRMRELDPRGYHKALKNQFHLTFFDILRLGAILDELH